MRFVVDDAAWASADISPERLTVSLTEFSLRLAVASERKELVVCTTWLWESNLVGQWSLADLLYGEQSPLGPSVDLRRALGRQLDKCRCYDDSLMAQREASIGGAVHVSPAAVLAHGRVSDRSSIACITPDCSGRRGPAQVCVSGVEVDVYYVVDEAMHTRFFRAAFEVDNADETGFAQLAPHAFPSLAFVENVWDGLRRLSRPYRDRRADLVVALGLLNDHGERIFGLPQREWIPHFGSIGLEVSPESSADVKPPCLRYRQRAWRDSTLTFDWHIKLDSNLDRIHIHPGLQDPRSGPIVGILTRHLPMSSRGEC